MSIKAANFSDFLTVHDLNESAKPNPSIIGKALQQAAEVSQNTKDKSSSPISGDPSKIKLWDLFAATEIGQDLISAIQANKELYKIWQEKGIISKDLIESPLTLDEIEISNSGKSKQVLDNQENLKKIGLGVSEKPEFSKITASSEYKFGDYQELSWDDLKKILDKNKFSDLLDFTKYNIVALRNFLSVKKSYPNRFTDLLVLMSPEKDKNVSYFPATTVPGETFLLQKYRNWYVANGNASAINPKGLAIVQPGVYSYKIGKHKGSYEALVQKGPVKVQRYSPVDSESKAKFTTYSPGKAETGNFGINIHRANSTGSTPSIDTHSAGCFVLQNSGDLSTLLSKLKKSNQREINVALVELDGVGKTYLASLAGKKKPKDEKSV